MKIVVTGATGFIGRPVVAALLKRGDHVVALSRNAPAAAELLSVRAVEANLEAVGAWQEELRGVDAVIHLAGEPLTGRWDAQKKQRLRDSRVESSRMVAETIAALPADQRPRVLVSASGGDFYPFANPKLELGGAGDNVTEKDPIGEHFLARVCGGWEAEARAVEKHGVRAVQMRQGLVLGPGGGALAPMVKAFKVGLGGRMGSGKQFWSWVHLDDVVAMYLTATVDESWTGPINVVGPELTRQSAFASALGHALHRPSIVPTPAFALKIALGEFAEYLLNGRPMVPTRLQELGFGFTRPTLADALRDV